jgi:hypothetical protein
MKEALAISWIIINKKIFILYFNLVHGNQWATSTEISVATRILQSNTNSWLQGRDGQNNICFTKEEYINSSFS